MNYRRSFIVKAAGISLGTLSFSLFNSSQARAPEKKYFFHHVFFWLREPDNPEARSTFEAALKELGTVKSIKFLHIGKPADTDREVIDNSYHYSFLVGFRDKAGHDVYQEHPVHDKFRNEYSHMWTKVLVYDSVNL
ncbi:MAG: Dabb family protein [Cyclobacteriaceae bacterium]|nr:Dabb family protein [Cyclobacteriaceae bacterium]